MQDEVSHMLHHIAARADSAGHVLLEGDEIGFASSEEGKRWLEEIDAGKRLYKLTREAQRRCAL
jgi:hypothetical protein